MQARLLEIQSNGHRRWDDFVAAPVEDIYDQAGWFTVEIGDDAHDDGEWFQVHIATPAAARRACVPGDGQFVGLIVESFEPKAIVQALQARLATITGADWPGILAQLRPWVRWEYEGLGTRGAL